ncbi:universal stress protein [Micromonospora echinofusca]|uniref:Universal stress protein n=1 Tax=Micromonospora echinofusca TaxID=47858 RepID=A0ABS3VKR8_MICEH|nr:universal stress protein [Micromonospora echinofusca]MBO4205038.1 universal stress protein [Micromonospora echinofusca]
MDTTNAAIVVGVDGSEPALRAVRLAAAEAARQHRPLRVVHAFVWPLLRVPVGPPPGGPPGSGLRHQAERVVAESVAAAEAAAPGITVTSEIVDGEAAAVLLGQSPRATLIVIGDRGLGGFGSMLLGSVAVQVSAYAACPVLVARGAARSDGPVVVGVDGSPRSRAAVAFAADQAAWRGAELVALHAWRYPASEGPGDMQPLVYDEREVDDEERRILAESTAGLAERYPEVTVTRRVVRARPARALVEESRRAQLVVVGARGLGGFAALVLGSVSHTVLHHSDCPVAVLRHDR